MPAAEIPQAGAIGASAARPASGPELRFGLRSLLGLMGVCSVQFALVARLGALIGFLLGAGVCLLALCCLLALAVVTARRSDRAAIDRLDGLVIRLTVAVTVLIIATAFSGGGAIIYRQAAMWRLAKRVSGDLGFDHLVTPIVSGDRVRRVVRVTGIVPGSEFALAGAQVGDVIVTESSPAEFFTMLEANRGESIAITLASGSEIQPLDNWSRRTVEITMPAANRRRLAP